MSKKSASFHMNPIARAARALAVLASVTAPGWAWAQLSFTTEPPIQTSGGGSTTIKTDTITTTTPGSALPNVIIGLDVTPSMDYRYSNDAICVPGSKTYTVGGKSYTRTCPASGRKDRMTAMQDALIATFSDSSLVGKFRLAFQSSYWDFGFGPNRFFPNPLGYDNSMKLFDAIAQAQFVDWTANLTTICSATAALPANAGEYLKGRWHASNSYFGSGASSDYAGYVAYYYSMSLASFLSYWGINTYSYNQKAVGNWAMTCGMNNSSYNSAVQAVINPSSYLNYTNFLGGKKPSETGAAGNPWNATSALAKAISTGTKVLPATTDPNPPLTCRRSYFIFMTDGGSNGSLFSVRSIDPSDPKAVNYYNKTQRTLPDGEVYDPTQGYATIYKDNAIGNLSSQAFYYWSTDLTGAKSGVVDNAKTMTAGDQTYGSKFYPAYWNPQNDPATWQHMQTYAVGFGTAPTGAGQFFASTATPNTSKTNWTVCNPNLMIPVGNTPFVFNTPGLCSKVGLPSAVAMPAFDSQFGNFFTGYASGTYQWPYTLGWGDDSYMTADLAGGVEAVLDLPHATYNGRGKFFPATSVSALSNAFATILQEATAQSAPSTSTSTQTTTTTTAGATTGTASAAGSRTQLAGNMAYVASYAYDTAQAASGLNGWSGSITGYAGSSLTGSAVPEAIWWTQIPSPSSRQIFTTGQDGKSVVLDAANTGVDAAVIDIVRNLPLGDIVNSQLVVVGKPTLQSLNAGYLKFKAAVNTLDGTYRQNMVYVGANDGMLHAFDAGDGTPKTATGTGAEQFAYVPRGLLGSLSAFGSGYRHRYWVDGGIFSGDARLDRPTYASIDYAGIPAASQNWATVLVGTLGAGGKGYFVLDVTSPSALAAAIKKPDAETLEAAVLADTTGTDDADIGHQFGQPVVDEYNLNLQSAQIVQINTKDAGSEWAVIMGNGYNSTDGLPVLLIQSLSAQGRPLYKVKASCTAADPGDCVKAGNGLGQLRAVDVDGNGTVDIVYAGDLMGNLWKFDISNIDHTKWKVAYNANPMFRAVGPTGAAQPITSAPVVVPNPKGGFMVGFGTGKNLTDDDTKDAPASANAPLNSFYALYDMQKMSASTVDVPDADPARQVSQITLDEKTVPVFCTGTTRCTTYLYHRTMGGLSTPNSDGLSWGTTDKPVLDPSDKNAEKIDGNPYLGWYYDIPETANGNAAKVLANPMMLSNNIVLFLADNVSSQSGQPGTPGGASQTTETQTSGDSPQQPSSGESCGVTTKTTTTTTTTTTTAASSTVKPPLRSANFFNLMTSAPPDNITFTINGHKYLFDNTDNPADGSATGNRFSPWGGDGLIRDGTDDLESPDGSSLVHKVVNSPGRRTGWRFGR